MQVYPIKIVFFFFLFLNGIFQLSAQESNRKKFTINEHEFISSNTVKSAKIETRLTTNLHYGSTGQLTSEGIIIEDREYLSFTGSLLYAGGGIDYRQKINDWFAIYINSRFLGRLGTQIPTILAEGINTASSTEIGWLFKVYEHQKGYLSGSIFTNRHKGAIIDFKGFVEDIINDIPHPQIIDNVPVSNVGSRIHYAHAFSKTLGAQLDLAYYYGETLVRNAKGSNLEFGVFADSNLYPAKQIPLGFGLGYNITSMPETLYKNDKMANIYSFSLAYTKALDFELGLEVTYHHIPLNYYKSKPKVITANLQMIFRF